MVWLGDEVCLSANITKRYSNAKGYERFGIDGWKEGRVTTRAVT